MTKAEAKKWVRGHSDDDELDDDDLVAVFTALYGRKPDQDDYDTGLWSLCCAGI